MAQNRTDNIKTNAPKHIDAWRFKTDGTPYASTTEAHSLLLYKFVGRDCVILKNGIPTEYWYKTSIASASNLVPKVPDTLHNNVAYVSIDGNDSTAQLSNAALPFATANAALDALPSTGGIINFGWGVFGPIDWHKMKSNVSIIGSGQPKLNTNVVVSSFDSITQTFPTGYSANSGTIIKGSIICYNKDNVTISNLGIDVGKTYIDSLPLRSDSSPNTQDGIVFSQFNLDDNQVEATGFLNVGNSIKDVTVLNYSNSSLQHDILVENCYNASITNVRLIGATHGFVNKSVGTIFTDSHIQDTFGEAINLKSNEVSTHGLFVRDTVVSNIKILNGGSATILLDNSHPDATGFSNVIIDTISIQGSSTSAIKSFPCYSDTSYKNITISNINIVGQYINPIDIVDAGENFKLSNINLNGAAAYGYQIRTKAGGVAEVTNCTSSNTGAPSFYFGGQGKVVFNNLSCYTYATGWGIQIEQFVDSSNNPTGVFAEVYGGTFFVDDEANKSFGPIKPLQIIGDYVSTEFISDSGDLNTIDFGLNKGGMIRFDPAPAHTPDNTTAGEPVSYTLIQQGNSTRGLQTLTRNSNNRMWIRSGSDVWGDWRELTYQSPTSQVYVQSFGSDTQAVIGDATKPFLTIEAALDALGAQGGVINIGIGNFKSPPSNKIRSNTYFIGTKVPTPNWQLSITDFNTINYTVPDRLSGGTVLEGQLDISLKDNIIVKNLGIDIGTFVEAKGYNVENGLIAAQLYDSVNQTHPSQETSRPRYGIIAENVIVLADNSLGKFQHDFLFENIIDPSVNNITAVGGFHGIVFKTIGGIANNLSARGCRGEGLIIKSDSYAFCRDLVVSNVSIGKLDVASPGHGIVLQSASSVSPLLNITLSNVNVRDVAQHGIYLSTQSDSAGVIGLNLNNVTITNVGQIGANFIGDLRSSNISNVLIKNANQLGMVCDNTANTTSYDNNVFDNVRVFNCGNPIYSAAQYSIQWNNCETKDNAGNMGMLVYGNTTRLSNFKSDKPVLGNSNGDAPIEKQAVSGANNSDNKLTIDSVNFGAAAFGINNSGSTNAYNVPTSRVYLGVAQDIPISFTTGGSEALLVNKNLSTFATPVSGLDATTNTQFVTLQQLNNHSATETDPLSVHLTGNQNVDGEKTFLQNLIVAKGANQDQGAYIFDGAGYFAFGINKSGSNNGFGVPTDHAFIATTTGFPIVIKSGGNNALTLYSSGILELGTGTQTHDDDASAGIAGLTTNMIYKTSTGELRVKL